MTDYLLRLLDPFGVYLATLDAVEALDYARAANDIGVLTLTLPPRYDFSLFRKDGRIEVYRDAGDGSIRQNVWIIRNLANALSDRGERRYAVTAFSPNELLTRRIVAVAAQGAKVGTADNLMKEVVTQNFVTPTDTGRTMPMLTVATSTGSAPSVALEFAERTVLDVLKDVAVASLTAGTYLAFDVVPVGDGFEFRTFVTAWGTDRRTTVVLAAERGTLADVTVRKDWIDERTAVYARGRGELDAALLATASDAARIALSPFGRSETFVNATNATTLGAVQGAADAELSMRRPREQFAARLAEQPGMRYGRDIFIGDLVQAEHDGMLYDCRVGPVYISLDGQGNETVDLQIRNMV